MRYTGRCSSTRVCPVRRHQAGMSAGARRVERDQAQHPPRRHRLQPAAQLEHELAAAEIAGVPLGIGGGRGRRLRSRRAPLVDLLDRARTSSCAGRRVLHDAAVAQGHDAIGVGAGEVHLVEAGDDGDAGADRGAERVPARVAADSGSRLATGSSARITAAFCASARAIATRCCWPPDSWSARTRRLVRESDRVEAAQSASWRSARVKRRSRTRHVGTWASRPTSTFSSAVSRRIRLNCWKMSATARRAARSSRAPVQMSRPSTWTVPRSGRVRPVRQRNSVVLPAPLGPSTATNSPGAHGEAHVGQRGDVGRVALREPRPRTATMAAATTRASAAAIRCRDR